MPTLALALLGCAEPPPPPPLDPKQCFTELATLLSADEMEGRGVGTAGLDKAADLLVERFRAAGLGDAGVGYVQPFTAVTGVALGAGNALADGGDPLVVGQDFSPLGFSSDGAFEGDVVFAGYGIVAPELGYDDYAGLDVKGKVVLAMRYEPGEADEKSPFDGKKPSRWSDLRYKAMRARELGAAALVLVAPAREADEPDKIPPLARGGPTSRAGIPVVQVSRAVADRWLAKAGTTLAEAQAKIDAATKPASMPIPGLRVSGTSDVVATEAPVRNVLGVIPGRGALAKEVVVLGAHYDHLGYGEHGSMRPDSREIHNGADDNASGTAAITCALAELARRPDDGRPRRTVLGIAFTAEEIGLGGSAYYTEHPVLPLEDTVAMVNLDMVGRVRENKISALGAETAPEWKEVIPPAAEAVGLEVALSGDGYGPSDHTSFYEHKIPVVHFFSGAHDEYHTPDDDAPTLNLDGGALVTRMVTDVVDRLATRDTRLTYVKSTAGPRNAGDSRGYGAWLGTVPDFTAMEAEEGGVKLADVRAGGPAERAGIRAGDVLVGLAGAEVQNLYDMTFVLQDHKPGETVDVVVLRDGQRLTLKATLGSRSAVSKPAGERNRADHGDFSVGADPALAGGGAHGRGAEWAPTAGKAVPELLRPDEKHLADLRQLTFGGENAEAYWSPDGRHLIFQRTPVPGGPLCDQQYVLDLTTGDVKLVSSGKGRTTCGYYAYPSNERILYATTEAGGEACPPTPDHSQGYVWPLYPSYDIVTGTIGQRETTPFLPREGYDAEATVCFRDGRVLFTSTRDGDLDLYVANADGSGLERLTSEKGYDGGAFFTPSCEAIVWRASRPTGEALADYERLLRQDMVRPSALELFWMDLHTRKVEQLTRNGAANFAPYPLPDESGVLWSSNVGGQGREFDIWMVKRAGGEPERITSAPGFDGFPMFDPTGTWLVFASNRATEKGGRDTNLFVARWVP